MSLYTRAGKEAIMSIATIVGSTAFEDIERGEFVDEELMVTSSDLKVRSGVYDDFSAPSCWPRPSRTSLMRSPTRRSSSWG